MWKQCGIKMGSKNEWYGLWPMLSEVEKLSINMLSCGLKSM